MLNRLVSLSLQHNCHIKTIDISGFNFAIEKREENLTEAWMNIYSLLILKFM